MKEIFNINAIRFFCFLLLPTLVLSSCGTISQKSMLNEVSDLTTAIIYNHPDDAYPFVESIISEDNFPSTFMTFHEMLKDPGYYRIAVVNFEYTTNNGITTYEGIYGIYTQNKGNFVVVASKQSDVQGFISFKIAPDTESLLPEPEDFPYLDSTE